MYAFASLGLDEPSAVCAGVASEGPLADLNYFSYSTAAERQIALEGVRARLGPDHYDQVLRYGSDLSYEEVVQYARQLFDNLEVEAVRARVSMQDAPGIA
jgi:hypothetical protein